MAWFAARWGGVQARCGGRRRRRGARHASRAPAQNRSQNDGCTALILRAGRRASLPHPSAACHKIVQRVSGSDVSHLFPVLSSRMSRDYCQVAIARQGSLRAAALHRRCTPRHVFTDPFPHGRGARVWTQVTHAPATRWTTPRCCPRLKIRSANSGRTQTKSARCPGTGAWTRAPGRGRAARR